MKEVQDVLSYFLGVFRVHLRAHREGSPGLEVSPGRRVAEELLQITEVNVRSGQHDLSTNEIEALELDVRVDDLKHLQGKPRTPAEAGQGVENPRARRRGRGLPRGR